MKKLILTICVFMYCLSGYAQSLSASPTTIESGGTVTISGVGETNSSYFAAITIPNTTGITSSSPDVFAASYIQMELVAYDQTYNNATHAPTSLRMKFTNSHPTYDYTITLKFNVVINGTTASNETKSITLTIKHVPAPTSYGNQARSKTFYKNDCASGLESDPYTYTVPANEFTATSQAAANALADAKIAANGQNAANANLTCKQVYYNIAVTGIFTKNDCPSGYEGADVTYVVSAGKHKSAISQADADQKAASDLSSNGQQYANASTGCHLRGSLRYINGVQEAGIRKCTESVPSRAESGYFDNTYHFQFSDGSISINYYETVLYQCAGEIEP